MLNFIISFFEFLLFTPVHRGLSAAEAFGVPARTIGARRWRIAALCLFVAASCLFLVAALLHTAAGQRLLGEIVGWTGVSCLCLCVACGLRYASINPRLVDRAMGSANTSSLPPLSRQSRGRKIPP